MKRLLLLTLLPLACLAGERHWHPSDFGWAADTNTVYILPAIARDSELSDYFKTAATNQFALDILSNVRTGDNVFSGSNYFTGPVVVDNGNDTSTFHNIVARGTITGDLSGATNLPSTSITGVIPMANLATGSYTGTQFVKGDGTLSNPPTSGGTSSVTWDSSNLILTLTDVVLSSLTWDTDNLIFTATY